MDILALQGLGPHADSGSQARALVYFEQLKESEEGWQICASALASGTYQQEDHIKFFCFQVVEHYLKTRYVRSGPAEQHAVQSFLMTWFQRQSMSAEKEKTFIKNKAAQIFSLAFVTDYPHRWPNFLLDILQSLANGGAQGVEVYLRILKAIDSEVVDREIVHTHQESERNTLIKDYMREQCVPQLVDSWYQIITNFDTSEPEVACLCLDVIGAYVSWIEINLVANDKFVAVLLKYLRMELLRESACECIHEVLSKGMDPVAKLKLVESFFTVLEAGGFLAPAQDEDPDYLSKLSKVVNGFGMNLMASWLKLVKTEDKASAQETLQALENKVPYLFRFLGDEDDDVSGAVSQFAHDYINILKQCPQVTPKQREHMQGLLLVVIKKMKFDESYNFDSEGEEEAMFQEYRKELKIIFNNLTQLDNNLTVMTVHEMVTKTLQQWESSDFRDIELAIYLMYSLGEALPGSVGQSFSAESDKATVLQQMMRTLIVSRVSCHPHQSVALQYFETIVRYEKFFVAEPQYISEALMSFLDERGLRHQKVQVCSRCAYLLSRFVRFTRAHIHGYIEEILTSLHDLLALTTPDNGYRHSLSTDDQLFIYETSSILIVWSQFTPQKKQELMKELLSPIVTKFDNLLNKLRAEEDERKQLAYAECLNQAMAFASRTSKGFTNQQTMKHCGCVEAYTDTLKIFLGALNTPVHRTLLHAGVRQFLHRMVVRLEAEILPFIPVVMEHLLKNPDAKELQDFIPLINQVVAKFKKTIVPFLQKVFMPIVNTIFAVLSAPADELDQVVASDKKLLQRNYFSFLATLVNNNVTEVLSDQEMQNLQRVLLTVIQGAVDYPDPIAQKVCFSILKKLVDIWGDKGGLAGFEEFMYKHIVPACFMAPMKPTFDLSDGQTVIALNESATCLKAILEKRGDEFLLFLQNEYLPTLPLAPELIQEYCNALKSDNKFFKAYLKSFFTRAKS